MAISQQAQVILRAYPKAGAALAQKIVEVAARLECSSYALANLINFESAGTFSSSVKNQISGATGLIQFYPTTMKRMGVTAAQLSAMSPVEQMDWVEAYLRPYEGKLTSEQALYMAVFQPVAMHWPPETEFEAKIRRANPGINRVQDYIDWVNKKAKLPHGRSGEISLSKSVALEALSWRKKLLRVPWWVWVIGGSVFVVFALLMRRRRIVVRYE